MTRPEPCQVTLPRMGIGSVAFPLTVVRAPFTDVRCQTNSPAPRKTSSSVVRLLKNGFKSSASSTKRSANKQSARERKVFHEPDGVTDVYGSTYNEGLDHSAKQIFSRREGPDCQECSEFADCEATETGSLEGTPKTTSLRTENIPGEYTTSRTDTTYYVEATKNRINIVHRSKRSTKRKKAKRKSLTSLHKIPTKGTQRKPVKKTNGHKPGGQISKEATVISTPSAHGNKYLQLQKLRATYNPKGISYSRANTEVLLLPNLTNPKNLKGHLKANKVSPWKQKNEKKISKESPSVSCRKQLLTSNFPADGRIVKIYLSESHSEIITGVPSAPPGTPTADQLKAVQYIQSLMDIKSQRAVKAKLTTIGNQMRLEEQRWKEKAVQEEQKRAHCAFVQLRERQRTEIYALNKVMTDLENSNFKKFMKRQEDVASIRA